jgi:hypothetical protein
MKNLISNSDSLEEIFERERIEKLSKEFSEVKTKAILKHEEGRKIAKEKGEEWSLFPYELSSEFERKFKKENNIPLKTKI